MIKKRKNKGIMSRIMVLFLMLGLILPGVVPVVAAEISETPLVEVSFDPQGGTGTMDSVFCSLMTNITLPENGFMAPEGKTFKIWENEGKEYAPGAEITIGDDTVVKAVWEDEVNLESVLSASAIESIQLVQNNANQLTMGSGNTSSYSSQFNLNQNLENFIKEDEAKYTLAFDVNRPGANHDGITTAYNDGWWVWGSPIHDENWNLTSFTVNIDLHVAGQSKLSGEQMSLTVNNSATEPWNKYVWDGNTTFDGIGIPVQTVEVEYYTNDDGTLIKPHLFDYDIFLRKEADRVVLSIPKLENTVIAYIQGDTSYKDVMLVNNLKTEEIKNVIYLNGTAGNDNLDGASPETAVRSFEKAKEIAAANPKITEIIVIGTTAVEGEINLDGTQAKLVRGEGFNDYLLKVNANKTATLSNIVIDGNSEMNPDTKASLIRLESGSTMNITEGTVLRNNKLKSVYDNITNGGAIYARSATINMTGGTIEENLANNGGGIYLNGSTMNFTGGIVQNNTAQLGRDIGGIKTSGGGITVDNRSTLNMSGESSIKGNHSDAVGGGISVGSREWGPTNILNMDGGIIESNTSGGPGGGIFIQAKYYTGGASKAYITSGQILNNQMLGGSNTDDAFGGGGIYVNGANQNYGVNGGNGELYIKNLIMTDNTSKWEGGGYAACPISKTTIYVTDGTAIYGNTSEKNKGNELYILSSQAFGLHSGYPEYELSRRMLGGILYNWKYDDGTLLPDELYIGKLEKAYEELSLNTDLKGNDLTAELGKVIISGNSSMTRGGGIGSNGTVVFGTNDELVDISVTKTWEDNNNEAQTRPLSVTVNLIVMLNGQEYVVDTAILSSKNDWKATFTNLPKTHNGEHIEYKVKEVSIANGYTSAVTGDAEMGFTVTNSYTSEKTDVEGTKTWSDNNDQDGKRPNSITIRLLKNGTEIASKEVTEADGWAWSFTGLSKYENGELITYTITEDAVEGYSSEVSGYNVTNSYTPGKTSVQVTKAWKDNNNQDGKRPDAITIKLLADGEDTGKTLVLTATNNWTDTFTDLDEYKAGQKIVYTIEEVAVGNGYTSAVTGNAETGFTVTNSYTPPTEPTEPTPPTEPTEPTTPTEPTKPTTPTEPTKPTGPTDLPKTGEDSGPYLWLSSMCMSVGALLLLFRRKTKIQND